MDQSCVVSCVVTSKCAGLLVCVEAAWAQRACLLLPSLELDGGHPISREQEDRASLLLPVNRILEQILRVVAPVPDGSDRATRVEEGVRAAHTEHADAVRVHVYRLVIGCRVARVVALKDRSTHKEEVCSGFGGLAFTGTDADKGAATHWLLGWVRVHGQRRGACVHAGGRGTSTHGKMAKPFSLS